MNSVALCLYSCFGFCRTVMSVVPPPPMKHVFAEVRRYMYYHASVKNHGVQMLFVDWYQLIGPLWCTLHGGVQTRTNKHAGMPGMFVLCQTLPNRVHHNGPITPAKQQQTEQVVTGQSEDDSGDTEQADAGANISCTKVTEDASGYCTGDCCRGWK